MVSARLSVTYSEAGRGRPDAVALAVENGRLVDIAGTDEATQETGQMSPPFHLIRVFVSVVRYLWSTYATRTQTSVSRAVRS